MRKPIAAALVALTVAGSFAAAATPADAQSRYGYNHHRRGGDNSDAIIAGIAGLAIGAALGSSSQNNRYPQRAPAYGYYDDGYRGDYGPGYGASYGRGYGSGYGYAPSYRVCERSERVYDYRTGRRVIVRSQYAC